MKIKYEYKVIKMFAIGDSIHNIGDIVELSHDEANTYVKSGKVIPHFEKEEKLLNVDTKGIEETLRNGLEKYAPKNEVKYSFSDFLRAVTTNTVSDLVKNKGVSVGTNQYGGYCATTFTEPNIDIDLIRESGLVQLATMITLGGTANSYKFNLINSMDSGGSAITYVTESNPIGLKQPTLYQFAINLLKATFAMNISAEATEDTGSLSQEIASQVPEQMSLLIENGMVNGDAAFEGIIGNAATYVVAKESGQTAATINHVNIENMIMSIKNIQNCVFVMSRSAFQVVMNIENDEGEKIWEMDGTRFGRLRGIPVLVSDKCPAIGNNGDIILCSPSKYRIISKGLKLASSTHYQFLSDTNTLKMTWRLGGKPGSLKLTSSDSKTLADFVTLEARGDEFESSSSSSSNSSSSSEEYSASTDSSSSSS